MRKKLIYFSFLLTLLNVSVTAFAWDHSVELGYGYSHDPNHTRYKNQGVMLSSDILPIWRNPWTFWSINGSFNHWHTNAPKNKNISAAALSLALRFYPYDIANLYPTYLLGSVGPAYLSSRRFGKNTQGSHLSIQTDIGLGVEIQSFDVNLRLAHYSNAGLAKPNEGFNILYMLSIGYLF